LRMAIRVRRVDQRVVLGAFSFVKSPFVGPLAEKRDSRLYRWIDTERDNTPRGFRVQAMV